MRTMRPSSTVVNWQMSLNGSPRAHSYTTYATSGDTASNQKIPEKVTDNYPGYEIAKSLSYHKILLIRILH